MVDPNTNDTDTDDPTVDCDPLNQADCEAAQGCHAVEGRLVNCATATSAAGFAGCIASDGPSGEGITCNDQPVYCLLASDPDALWFIRNSCVPKALDCEDTGIYMTTDDDACAALYAD